MSQLVNEFLHVKVDASGAFVAAFVDRLGIDAAGRQYNAGQVPLTEAEVSAAFEGLNAEILRQRNDARTERDALQQQLIAVTAERDSLAAELESLRGSPATGVVVTATQLRLALRNAGELARVDAALAAEEPDSPAAIAWQRQWTFRRDSQLLQQVATSLGFTAEQIDQIFAAASAIVL